MPREPTKCKTHSLEPEEHDPKASSRPQLTILCSRGPFRRNHALRDRQHQHKLKEGRKLKGEEALALFE